MLGTDFIFKNRYNIDDLIEIIKILRSENGCPWDKVQTHESIRSDLIEEACEVCEGIDCGSPEMLREELGDLLLQIAFHSQIETELGNFNFEDVCNDICQKLIYRHPHVFGKVVAETEDEVLKNWDELKKQSKNQETYLQTLQGVSKALPALMRGEKVCKRVMRAGLPINSAKDCIDNIKSGLERLENGGLNEKFSQNQQILGDLLLSVCNLGRILKTDSEEALTFSINRFIIDFGEFEKAAAEECGSFDKLPEDELRRVAEKLFGGL